MHSQQQKGEIFRALHERPGCFVIPNPWDAGSSKLLASLGFEALATTSAGLAFSLGRADGKNLISREETFANVRDIVTATSLPVSADLENGFHDDAAGVYETISQATAAGLVGGSIEDATGDADNPIYSFELAVERMTAAVEAAKASPFPFVLTARAENFLYGRPNLEDTIRRLQAFQEAGADVLFAPGLKSREDIATLVREVDLPVSVVMGLSGVTLSVQELTEIGVKRISLGSSLNRAALGALLGAADEILTKGTFSFAENAAPYGDLNMRFGK
ncbi:MAG: isocitrate lyase/phosphoenolpyruvate mutase family protein [Motiliproteus sp.]